MVEVNASKQPTNRTIKELFLVKTIIQQAMQKFHQKIEAIFSSPDHLTMEQIEKAATEPLEECVCEIMSGYAQQLDQQIHQDKAGRKAEGLVVVRRNEERTLMTSFGEVSYHRTYYRVKATGEYRHPVDEMLAVEPNTRISKHLSLALVNAAKEMSYAKSVQYVAKGKISRQSVMRAVRHAQPKEQPALEPLRKVAVLHIDADEDHVALHNGKRTMVPLISVYEGMEEGAGGRQRCKGIFHISEYGLKAPELWEKTLSELEKRYDLEGTIIYLHGDGAPWIQTGLEWLPNSRHVLDKFHKNKSLKKVCAGLKGKTRKEMERALRAALNEGDAAKAEMLIKTIEQENPDRVKQIQEQAEYLLKHIDAVAICQREEEANNGGSSEPHVSHILSSRLSSRPMSWSAETLKRMAPLLASQGEIETIGTPRVLTPLQKKAERKVKKSRKAKNTLGLPAPDAVGRLKAIALGQKNATYKAVVPYV